MPQKEEKELSTEEKAALIGKDIGVVEKDLPLSDKEEEAPDYDITEEGSETTSDKKEKDKEDGEEDDDHDERLSKQKYERAKLSNREKRALKKKRLSEKMGAKDAEIRMLRDQVNALAVQNNEVYGRLSQVDQAQLQQAWNDTKSVFDSARSEHMQAFKDGDGEKATAAMEKMYEARRRLDELQAINARQQQPKRDQQNPDPSIKRKAEAWASRNPWYVPNKGNEDSVIAEALAEQVVKEGFDPKSDEYYEELDERLAQRSIGGDDAEEEEDETPKQHRNVRRSPPVGGGGGRGDIGNGRVPITLPTAFINTLKDNGIWEDIEKRNKIIKRYIEGEKDRVRENRR